MSSFQGTPWRKTLTKVAVFMSLCAGTVLVAELLLVFAYEEGGLTLPLAFVIVLYAALGTFLLTRPRRSGSAARSRERR